MSFSNRERLEETLEHFERRLNSNQVDAISSIIDEPVQDDCFLLPIIDGPPGTGKTTVGAYASLRAIFEGKSQSVLYIAPTNFAASQAKQTFERLGVESCDVVWLNPRSSRRDWDRGVVGARYDLSDLGPNDIRRLRSVPIIICTPYMLGRVKKGGLRPSNTKVIIDEFSQIDPALFFMILSRTGASADRYLRGGYALLGDPLQLPVVTTQRELMQNVLEFILSHHTIDGGLNSLTLQYRMHIEICNAVNRMRRELSFWRDFRPLEPSNEARFRDLIGLGYEYTEQNINNGCCLTSEELKEILDPSYTFVVVNTDKLRGSTDEEQTQSGSRRNEAEAEAAVDIAIAAHQAYHRQHERLVPQIISPYNAQVCEIKYRLRRRPQALGISVEESVITAYKSQGKEFPFVIVSLVRKNPERRIGFLEDEKLRAQIYVACSRAQGKLILLMSQETFGGKPLYEELVNIEGSRHALLWGWD